jgi:hypothetical protein
MKPYIKYIEQLGADKELINSYRELREYFQSNGWSEKDLENPPYYSAEVMVLHGKVRNNMEKFRKEIISFFGDTVTIKELDEYIFEILNKVNLETPLSDTDYPRKKNDDEWA